MSCSAGRLLSGLMALLREMMCTESLSANLFCKNQRRSVPISDWRDRLKNALFLATPVSCWSLKIPAGCFVVLVNVQDTVVRRDHRDESKAAHSATRQTAAWPHSLRSTRGGRVKRLAAFLVHVIFPEFGCRRSGRLQTAGSRRLPAKIIR